MASWARSRIVVGGGSLRATARVLILVVILSGCRSAAAVFLDIPPGEADGQEQPENVRGARVQAGTGEIPAGVAGTSDTVRAPLPIEQTADPDSVLGLLPRAADGALDWNEAIRLGVIDPRPGPDRDSDDGRVVFGFDFYFGEFETLFPHSGHVRWMTCDNCHPSIFRTRGTRTSMKEIGEGASCGTCHGKVAFAVEACDRCHPALAMPEGRLQPDLGGESRFRRDSTSEVSFVPSVFAHWIHRLRFECSACHPDPFPMRAGVTGVTMEAMQGGAMCGKCHDGRTAFGLVECTRCHKPEEAAAS